MKKELTPIIAVGHYHDDREGVIGRFWLFFDESPWPLDNLVGARQNHFLVGRTL
jgi:hypothetical protein